MHRNSSPLNILMSSDSYWPRVNGVSVSVSTFRTELTRQGHNVHLFSPAYPQKSTDIGPADDARVHRIPAAPFFFSPEDMLVHKKTGRKILQGLIDREKPQVLHSQTEFSTYELFLEMKKKRGLPLVMTSHTYWEQYLSNYIRFIPPGVGRFLAKVLMRDKFQVADLIVVPSVHMKNVLERYEISAPKVVIPTGINASDMKGCDRDRRQNPVSLAHPDWASRPILLFVGRLSQEKNVDFLLDILPGLKKKWPEILLVFVGDGPQRGSLHHRAVQKGLDKNIHFTGYIPREEMKHWYSLSDVFVFPSVTETQGLVTIESMLCGTPVVAIGEMGTREVMAGDNGGFMVSDSPEEFSQKVEALLQDRDLWTRKSQEALNYAQGWTIEAQAGKLVNAYRTLL